RRVAFQYALDKKLRPAVRIHGPLRVRLRDRRLLWLAIGCAGGGEDDAPDTALLQCFDERTTLPDVVGEIQPRLYDRLADISVSRKMYARLYVVPARDARDERRVADVAAIERYVRADGCAMPARQVIE